MGAPFRAVVAVQATDLKLPRVHLVGKGDGLDRFVPLLVARQVTSAYPRGQQRDAGGEPRQQYERQQAASQCAVPPTSSLAHPDGHSGRGAERLAAAADRNSSAGGWSLV